jgi:hypothetical protein
VGTAGSDHAELRRCLKVGQYASACAAARSLAVVPLDAALDLTLLAAEKAPDRYEAMARRWLVRFMEETEPGLPEISLTIAHLRAQKRPPPKRRPQKPLVGLGTIRAGAPGRRSHENFLRRSSTSTGVDQGFR